jgi:hypothetical protein
VAGRDPRSPEGDLARRQAGKMGSRPAMKRFLPRTVFSRVPSAFPWSTSASPSPHQNGTQNEVQNEVQNDPWQFAFCDPYRIRSRKCRCYGARDGCGISTSVPSGALPREPPGSVPPSLLRPISGRPIPRIHRGSAGCRNAKGRGRHGSEGCVCSPPRDAGRGNSGRWIGHWPRCFPRKCSERTVRPGGISLSLGRRKRSKNRTAASRNVRSGEGA